MRIILLSIFYALLSSVTFANGYFCASTGRAWLKVSEFESAEEAIQFATSNRKIIRFSSRRVFKNRSGLFVLVTGQVRSGTYISPSNFPAKPSLVNGCEFVSRIWGSENANYQDSGEQARDNAKIIKRIAPLIPKILENQSSGDQCKRKCKLCSDPTGTRLDCYTDQCGNRCLR